MFLRKKPVHSTPSYQRDPVEFLLFDADQRLVVCRTAIPQNQQRQQWALVARNADTAFRSVLEKVALLARAKGDVLSAREQLRAGAEFAAAFSKAAEFLEATKAADCYVHIHDFTHAFLWAMLSCEWGVASRLVAASGSRTAREEGGGTDTGGVHDVIARMVSATVADDAKSLHVLVQRYTVAAGRDPFFAQYFRYELLMTKLIERNTSGFNSELQAAESRFRARGMDKASRHEQVLDGCAERNAWVFDVWATALLNLARYRGMGVSIKSELIPLAFAA